MSFQQAAWNYRKNAILTAPPEKLVVLLYDGAIGHLEKARVDLGKEELASTDPAIGESLSKALAIIGELRSCLDMEKGKEISTNLERLYEFCTDRIMQANIQRESTPVEETLTVLRTLKEGWDGILLQGI